MKIVIEENIPFLRGIFDEVADVAYLAAKDINARSLKDASAIITRTRPHLDASNLSDAKNLRIIATATIGTDHIDCDYCKSRGIKVVNAPGCNAPAVAQWVYASLFSLSDFEPVGKTIGVVGVGHVGSIVADWGRRLGFDVMLNDPPRALKENNDEFVSLKDIAQKADIITFHTPLTTTGNYPTWHLADDSFFESLSKSPVIINAARGEVTDTGALLKSLKNGKICRAIVDCWENEPDVDDDLVKLAEIATPHIAGYSIEGKQRASATAAQAVADCLGLIPVLNSKGISLPMPLLVESGEVTKDRILDSFNPKSESEKFKLHPERFETLRNTYSLRHEL